MKAVSDEFRVAVGESHTRVSRLVILRGGSAEAGVVYPSSGSVTADLDASPARQLDAVVPNPDGVLTPTGTGSLLAPWSAWCRAESGVRFADGSVEWVPVGVFRLGRPEESRRDGTVRLEGADAIAVLQRPTTAPWVIAGGTDTSEAIARLLSDRVPALQFALPVSGVGSTPPLVLPIGSDPWEQAQRLAAAVGYSLTVNAAGTVVMLPGVADPLAAVALTLGDGDAWDGGTVVLDVEGEEVANVVTVIGTHSSSGEVSASAADDDPTSPTFVGGDFGRRTRTVTSSMVSTVGQAQALANRILADSLAATETVDWSMVPNPALDVGDTVVLVRSGSGLDASKRWLVTRIELPLVAGVMSVSARRVRGGDRITDQGVDT